MVAKPACSRFSLAFRSAVSSCSISLRKAVCWPLKNAGFVILMMEVTMMLECGGQSASRTQGAP